MARRYARTATTDIIRMRARLTGTTGLVGSTAGCLSEQVRGSAAGLDSGRDSDLGDLDLGGPDSADDLDSAGVPGSADGQDLVVGRESEYVDRLVLDSAAEWHAEVALTPAAASMAEAVPMWEAARTAEAVHMVAATAADTGKT
jgi:hypothetical protein